VVGNELGAVLSNISLNLEISDSTISASRLARSYLRIRTRRIQCSNADDRLPRQRERGREREREEWENKRNGGIVFPTATVISSENSEA